jgi:hypothetical protein
VQDLIDASGLIDLFYVFNEIVIDDQAFIIVCLGVIVWNTQDTHEAAHMYFGDAAVM